MFLLIYSFGNSVRIFTRFCENIFKLENFIDDLDDEALADNTSLIIIDIIKEDF